MRYRLEPGQLDAIVLAGGGPDPGLDPQAPSKALVSIVGRPMVVYVLEALRAVRWIGRIAVVGPKELPREVVAKTDLVVEERGDLLENLLAGIESLQPEDGVLAVASDLPLLTAASVEGFLDAAREEEADFYYAIVPYETVQKYYPGVRKTHVRVAEGTFCGGSVFLLDPAVIQRLRPLIRQAIAARKSPLALGRLFGWRNIVRFLLRRISIRDLEAFLQETTGVKGKAVITPHPEVAIDVDARRPGNLRIIQQALATR
ncbi:MAG: nucleotidyltransferase family protein [Armatimonadota bacterium]|nr:nucleotidyltransferase family protein [Armatimonadota bacterium]